MTHSTKCGSALKTAFRRPGEPHHCCAGEPITIRLMTQAVQLLTRGMRYRVGMQEFSISMHFMPSLPKDGFVIHDVRPCVAGANPGTHPGDRIRGCSMEDRPRPG